MAVELNHTIVHARDRDASAAWAAEVLGLPAPVPFGPFLVVEADNGVSLDYIEAEPGEPVASQHYAFLVGEDEFDAAFARITSMQLTYYADPAGARPGEINRHDGGRGCYFADPSGHWFEIITRPYGSGGG